MLGITGLNPQSIANRPVTSSAYCVRPTLAFLSFPPKIEVSALVTSEVPPPETLVNNFYDNEHRPNNVN